MRAHLVGDLVFGAVQGLAQRRLARLALDQLVRVVLLDAEQVAAQPVDLGLQTRLHRAQRLVVRQPPRRLFVQLRLLVQTHLQARPNQLSLV